MENRCIGCRMCVRACRRGALQENNGGLRIARDICYACGCCADVCPTNALEKLGRTIELDELVSDLLKDQVYYQSSGGGVTASGGEPTLQAAFTAALFERLRAEGVHTALDTCGMCSRSALEAIIHHSDLVLYDLKEMDELRHRHFIGGAPAVILENLRWVSAACAKKNIALWVRTPLIPGATARPENLRAIGAFLAGLPGPVARWELCAFNNLCRDKYRRLDIAWPYAHTPLLTQAELDEYADVARASGIDPRIVHATGAVSGSNSYLSESMYCTS